MDAAQTGWVPAGWPVEVDRPGEAQWELSASVFLFDCCPSDYRDQPVLRRHLVVLARFAESYLDAALEASPEGLSGLRRRLVGLVEPQVVEAAVEAWQAQQARLQRRRREVAMVSDALRGVAFRPRL